MPSQWLTNLSLSGWNFPGINWDQSWFCCCHFCCKISRWMLFFSESETQNQGCQDRGTVAASTADSAARMQHHGSGGGIYPVPWNSHHTLWQRGNRATFLHCFILHVHLASRSETEPPRQQPHHCSTTFVTLTNELHTRNCSPMLSSDSISPHPCYG